ncbi:MAG: hypothetical protein OXU30_14315 [Gammaproteobacteria bacterium]|nr:hypothetical protein [Gammaproteobacteria bacterium]MDD9894407.1 hypothetical protein [Gammaproteobacteria bacterium]
MFTVKSQSIQKKPAERARNLAAHALLCFLLVFVQGADLVHSHDGDLQQQFDCEICLKANSNEDAVASSDPSRYFNTVASGYGDLVEQRLFVAAVPANSRAPPLV